MTKDNNLIASIFSSAVKTSRSQQQNVPKKKGNTGIVKKKKPTPPNNAPAVKTSPATVDNNQTKPDPKEWVSVGPKKAFHSTKATKVGAGAGAGTSLAKPPPTKKEVLTTNAFYVPKTLEKKLHQVNKVAQPSSKKRAFSQDDQEATNTSPQTKSKSYRKHQARSLKRAKQRAEKEKAKAQLAFLKQKVELLQTLQDMTISDDDEDGATSRSHDETATTTVTSTDESIMEIDTNGQSGDSLLLSLPYEVLTNGVLSFLRPEEMTMLGSCSKYSKTICEEGYLWQSLFRQRFPASKLTPRAMKEWKRAYQLSLSKIVDRLRCFSTQKTFMEDVLGVLVNFTVNPKTKSVDYIELSQDLLSETAFVQNRVRNDVFGNSFKLFLPLYFSEEHFQRALPHIQKTILALARDRRSSKPVRFDPLMVLDVFPKIVTTFVVLLGDQGIAASRKSYDGLIRVHRLFLALVHQYPQVQLEALRRLKLFVSDENNRTKAALPNLGAILPLLMIVDQKVCGWPQVRLPYVAETFDRMVLWSCKKYPQLERTHDAVTGAVESQAQAEERVELTLNASTVVLRLMMFHVYFLKALCQGTTQDRANRYDRFFGQPEPKEMSISVMEPVVADVNGHQGGETKPPYQALSSDSTIGFAHFREQINYIMSVQTWQKFLAFVGLPIPPSKAEMARRLRCHVVNSRRKKYHTAGMDFGRVQASGTSRILSKGQEYSASKNLRRVVFRDTWNFVGGRKYLDATCLLYKGKKLLETVDYSRRRGSNGAVAHSGDVMQGNGGSHTIQLNLERLNKEITSCVFVLSAWASATLADIVTPSVSFENAEADGSEAQLCTYNLDSQDKVSYLTSVIMCRLYRVSGGLKDGTWHVQAIGDSHKGDASNYGPIYEAVAKLM